MYKINFDKIIGSGHQGSIYETNKQFVTKYPVSEKEIKASQEMSNIIGPKIIKVIKTKTFNETKKLSLNNKEIKLKGNFMIMERLNGLDLNYYIQEEDVFIEDDAFWIQELVIKIKKMHKLGYHHNDLTTSNIFIIFNEINKVIMTAIKTSSILRDDRLESNLVLLAKSDENLTIRNAAIKTLKKSYDRII